MSFLPDKPVKRYKRGGMVNIPKDETFATQSTSGDKTIFIPKSNQAQVIQKPKLKPKAVTKLKAKKRQL